tara:strand:- start:1605 stop:1955 length:351 start_codon:yes stop_codon:yes gene_type:complete
MANINQEVTGVKHTKKELNNKRKGDFAEYYAVTWLWDNGYEVFQNSGCTGPIDMIAMNKKGEVTFIDVKTFKPQTTGNKLSSSTAHSRTKKQVKLGVKILGFDPENRQLRFVEHQK